MAKENEEVRDEEKVSLTDEQVMDVFGRKMAETFPQGFVLDSVNRAIIVTLIQKKIVTVKELVKTIENMNEMLKEQIEKNRARSNIIVPKNPSFDPNLINELKGPLP